MYICTFQQKTNKHPVLSNYKVIRHFSILIWPFQVGYILNLFTIILCIESLQCTLSLTPPHGITFVVPHRTSV